nr:hypothetical protein [uncultured Lachnoclostridium sp.]
MKLVQRKVTDRGGYMMMPLVENVPEPGENTWKQTTCPRCKKESSVLCVH